jgi:hypothetical protein
MVVLRCDNATVTVDGDLHPVPEHPLHLVAETVEERRDQSLELLLDGLVAEHAEAAGAIAPEEWGVLPPAERLVIV